MCPTGSSWLWAWIWTRRRPALPLISANIQDAATDQKYFNEPLVNIIPFACNACPPKQVRITDSCQGCISHPCMNVCPKDAIYLDREQALPH